MQGLRLFVSLVHYPVYNRKRETVATAITNLDIHDLARTACAFGVEEVLVVNPLDRQQWLLERIVRHWKTGHGACVHPSRREALELICPVRTLEEAIDRVSSQCGRRPVTVATSARVRPDSAEHAALRKTLLQSRSPVMIHFGTGWGLTDEVIEESDLVLRPIMAEASYNHLSVRSAAAIILDRLLGDR